MGTLGRRNVSGEDVADDPGARATYTIRTQRAEAALNTFMEKDLYKPELAHLVETLSRVVEKHIASRTRGSDLQAQMAEALDGRNMEIFASYPPPPETQNQLSEAVSSRSDDSALSTSF